MSSVLIKKPNHTGTTFSSIPVGGMFLWMDNLYQKISNADMCDNAVRIGHPSTVKLNATAFVLHVDVEITVSLAKG